MARAFHNHLLPSALKTRPFQLLAWPITLHQYLKHPNHHTHTVPLITSCSFDAACFAHILNVKFCVRPWRRPACASGSSTTLQLSFSVCRKSLGTVCSIWLQFGRAGTGSERVERAPSHRMGPEVLGGTEDRVQQAGPASGQVFRHESLACDCKFFFSSVH